LTAADPLYIGVDLGGTKTLAIVASPDGRIHGQAVNPSRASGPAEGIVEVMAETARQAAADAGVSPDAVRCIGIAAAGAIHPERGEITWSPHISAMQRTPVAMLFRSHWDIPTFIGNDANLAALGEQRYGAGSGHEHIVFVTVSTGIGTGVIVGGRLYTGAHGLAGEAGHMTVEAHGPYGKSTTPGAWESLCSGTALVRIAGERMEAGEDSALRTAYSSGELDAEQIFDAMREGDELARSLVADAIVYLGAGLTSLVNVLDPAVLIIGGGLSNEWDSYIAPAMAIMRQQAFARVGELTKVVPAQLGSSAGALGAVALAHYHA
jgi:glucokinase